MNAKTKKLVIKPSSRRKPGSIALVLLDSGFRRSDEHQVNQRFPNLAGLLILLLLAACSSQPPAPVEDREVNARVREPASEDSAGVQVYSLQNPAVKQLVAQAKGAEQTGNLDQAGGYLERALRIQPRDPQLLQHMAEIKLQKEDYQQALNFAVRSYDIGPRVGEICSRNWRTISVAREHLDDTNGASDAEARASQCMNTRPKAF